MAIAESAAAAFVDALLERCTSFLRTRVLEGLEEAVEEDLGFALFVALDVLLAPLHESLENLATRHAREDSQGRRGCHAREGRWWAKFQNQGISGSPDALDPRECRAQVAGRGGVGLRPDLRFSPATFLLPPLPAKLSLNQLVPPYASYGCLRLPRASPRTSPASRNSTRKLCQTV